ncbi:MAG TPA: GAF domain-containing protein [Candidatus Lumbricidophila sp.]|nr:GAF domain-containing protein [Candidatus Lumbricidophila sp.]
MSHRPPSQLNNETPREFARLGRSAARATSEDSAVRSRLDALLRATTAMVELDDLTEVLRRIAQAAVDLVDAEYGALGVIAPDGDGLEAFVHVGLSTNDADAIGHLPEGRGVLGALIDDPHPIRLAHISEHPRSVGFPARHPNMDAFLGVPIQVRSEIYGNLYLANPRRGTFTEEDEQLVTALATTAGFVIANTRLIEETRLRQLWMSYSAKTTAALLDAGAESALGFVADELTASMNTGRICILVAGDQPRTMLVAETRGVELPPNSARVVPASGTGAWAVLREGIPTNIHGSRHDAEPDSLAITDADASTGPLMMLPLQTGPEPWGVLAIARRPGRPEFSSAEFDIAVDLANRCALAIEVARARDHRQRALLVEDRARIARDLHDHVIQQLFGTGLELQEIAAQIDDPILSERIRNAVSTLDDDIVRMRGIIFAMTPRPEHGESLRHRILDIAAECSTGLAQPVAVSFGGPVDLTVTGSLADDVAAATRELLMNAVRHASATVIRATVTSDADGVQVTITDDGVGIVEGGRRNGLENLATRARARGGDFRIDSEPGGTTVAWSAPLERTR